MSVAVKCEKVNEIARLLESIKPDDGIQTMLAEQMVATHAAAIYCLRLAVKQDHCDRNSSLNHAQRLMALYAKQVAALGKYRGKG
jgi:hypothetical protein